MKELSIEQKAKAYDEAIKRANELLYVSDKESLQCQTIKHILPELIESEGEKIRKELILRVIHDGKGYGRYTYNKNDYITWLEKQGEHANFRSNIQVGDKVTRNEAGMLVNISQLNRIAKPAKKQGEQKPIVIIPKFRVGDEIKTTNEEPLTITKIDEKGYWSEDLFICGFDDAAKWKLVEQKPAWSEEDEHWRQKAIDFMKHPDLIKAIPTLSKYVIDWLKSLKQRYTWKPSELQIEALESATENCACSEYQDCLRELIEKLKKLKE